MLRVIAGTHRGRRLATPAGMDTRPTSGRVREALFSMLGDVGGLEVLDLFAGSGALGIEALSRGAADATFIDASPDAVTCLRANLRAVGEERHVVQADWQQAARQLRAAGARFDLIFVDPPYAQAEGLAARLEDELRALGSSGARVVVESDRDRPLDLPLTLMRERQYGGTLLRIHEC